MKLLSKKTVFALFGAMYALLCCFYWIETRRYAEEESFKKIQNLLFMHKAIHGYVEDMQKPAVYKLKESGKLYKAYFSPEILSFTFIARNIKDYYNKERTKADQHAIYFKLASSNPRNPVNKATPAEDSLIKKFNTEKIKEYKSVIEEGGAKFLYYALPVQQNQASCMKCHGTPSDAPKELLDRYGDKAGFFEKLGQTRAIISIKAPLQDELAAANHIFWFLSGVTFAVFGLLYWVIAFFIGKLERLNKTLEEKADSEVQKRLESENILIQQNKMATMGEMIGAISHQWKQPLNSLGIMTQDVKYAYEYGELDKEYIEAFNKKATEQIQYMAKTIDDFRNFFKPNKEKKPFCITMALENAVKLLESQLKNNSIELDFDNTGAKVFSFGNQNEFSQAIINILNNAKDVLIEKMSSDKTLKALIKISIAKKDGKISIKISDNGGGIKEEIISKLFEPYTTSKESGTGIGLYMAKMIISDGFKGELTASNSSDGAVFEILIDEFIEN